MKSFGVDAEWIPGEERRHRLKMNAMKPSGNHTNVASVAGRRRRSAESARAAGPRRWVGPRGGCALRAVCTGANRRHVPASYRILYYFWQWQLINYWDDYHLELIPRPSSAKEMNIQRVFECENAWSGRADAGNQIRKERF